MLSEVDDAIAVVTHPIPYQKFYKDYIMRNKPCVITSNSTEHWSCRKHWVKNGQPNIDYLRENYGHLSGPVVDCDARMYSSHDKCEMKVRKYCDYWVKRNGKSLYLKDWHLQRNVNNIPFYEVPVYFTSDWLNEYWDNVRENDDYRFVYIGVKDTWTPFHADVFRSLSWSANICGLKKWLLFPPGEEEFLKDKFGNLPFDVTSDVDADMYQNRVKARQPIVVYQKAGEIIFVPSGWHHQVYNVEDTISVNHNWVNACCIDNMYGHLCAELISVQKEIADCQSMDGFHMQCQLILKASSGIDFKEFYEMLTYLIETRLKFVQSTHTRDSEENIALQTLACSFYISSIPCRPYTSENFNIDDEINLISFDLSKLRIVLEKLIDHEDFEITNTVELVSKGNFLLEQIDNVLQVDIIK